MFNRCHLISIIVHSLVLGADSVCLPGWYRVSREKENTEICIKMIKEVADSGREAHWTCWNAGAWLVSRKQMTLVTNIAGTFNWSRSSLWLADGSEYSASCSHPSGGRCGRGSVVCWRHSTCLNRMWCKDSLALCRTRMDGTALCVCPPGYTYIQATNSCEREDESCNLPPMWPRCEVPGAACTGCGCQMTPCNFCPHGYHNYYDNTTHVFSCIAVSNHRLSFLKAAETCPPAVITSDEKNQFMRNLTHQNLWLAIVVHTESLSFKWLRNGGILNYSNFNGSTSLSTDFVCAYLNNTTGLWERVAWHQCTSNTSSFSYSCETYVDRCSYPELNRCHHWASCVTVSTMGHYECQCMAGYSGDGIETCSDEDECDTGRHTCLDPGASCVNTRGSFVCTCEYGAGPTVCKPATYPCLRPSVCDMRTENCVRSWRGSECRCKQHHYRHQQGNSCQVSPVSPCDHGLTLRVLSGDSVPCCQGLVWNESTQKCVDDNECGRDVCSGSSNGTLCINVYGSFACVACLPGFSAVPVDGKVWPRCSDIDECAGDEERCEQGKNVYVKCENTPGSFFCDELDMGRGNLLAVRDTDEAPVVSKPVESTFIALCMVAAVTVAAVVAVAVIRQRVSAYRQVARVGPTHQKQEEAGLDGDRDGENVVENVGEKDGGDVGENFGETVGENVGGNDGEQACDNVKKASVQLRQNEEAASLEGDRTSVPSLSVPSTTLENTHFSNPNVLDIQEIAEKVQALSLELQQRDVDVVDDPSQPGQSVSPLHILSPSINSFPSVSTSDLPVVPSVSHDGGDRAEEKKVDQQDVRAQIIRLHQLYCGTDSTRVLTPGEDEK